MCLSVLCALLSWFSVLIALCCLLLHYVLCLAFIDVVNVSFCYVYHGDIILYVCVTMI